MTTVTLNMHVNFISMGFLVVDLGFLVMKINFAFSKNQAVAICKLKIVLNIPCQSFSHTSTTVTINMHINFVSIGFLVADLVMLAMKIDFAFSKNRYMQTQNCT